MIVEPSASFEAVAKFETGLTGTLGIRILDNVGGETLARRTSGIAEFPAGSGIYAVTLTAPGTAGQYTLAWDDGSDRWAVEDLLVTSDPVPATIGSGHLYVTAANLKEILNLQDGTYANTAIDIAVAAASDAINAYKGTRYFPTDETRYYTPGVSQGDALYIDDVVSVAAVTVDTDGDLVYDATWVEGVDFVLDPPNEQLEGRPKREIVLLPAARRRFPTTPHAVKVEGSFGWAEAPTLVQEAAVLLANRWLTRNRSAPLGILVAQTQEAVAMARLGRIDPDAAFLLDQLPATKPVARSIQLS